MSAAWINVRAIARFVILIGYLVPVIYQTTGEFKNYGSNLASTATWTEEDANPNYPTVVVCLKRPFKTKSFALTAQEFENATYTFDEVFYPQTLSPSNKIVVTTLFTRYLGRCFSLAIDPSVTHETFVSFKLRDPRNTEVFMVSKHQEVCVLFGLCNTYYPLVRPARELSEIWLSVHKKIGKPA